MNNISTINNESINGYFHVLNYGGFVTRFSVTYKFGCVYYHKFSGEFPIGQFREIIVPRTATNISFFVEIESFPFVWAGIFKNFYTTSDTRCFVVYGLSFLPYIAQYPCKSPGFRSNI